MKYLAAILFPLSLLAETLEWNPNPANEHVAYVLHYGKDKTSLTKTNTGSSTRCTVKLSPNATWWFAVSAVNTNTGVVSDLSPMIYRRITVVTNRISKERITVYFDSL